MPGVRQLAAAFAQASLLAVLGPGRREQARRTKAAASCRTPESLSPCDTAGYLLTPARHLSLVTCHCFFERLQPSLHAVQELLVSNRSQVGADVLNPAALGGPGKVERDRKVRGS